MELSVLVDDLAHQKWGEHVEEFTWPEGLTWGPQSALQIPICCHAKGENPLGLNIAMYTLDRFQQCHFTNTYASWNKIQPFQQKIKWVYYFLELGHANNLDSETTTDRNWKDSKTGRTQN